MDRSNEIKLRLEAVSDKEWMNIIHELTAFVHFKLQGWKMKKGAHSEQNLGIDAVNYYVNGAIEKIFYLKWDWKYEKYSLLEQLKLTIGSMMSSNVEIYKNKKIVVTTTEDDVLNIMAQNASEDYSDETYKLFRQALDECSKDNEDLQLYVLALDEGRTFDELSDITGFDKTKLYALQKKIGLRVKKYLQTKKEKSI